LGGSFEAILRSQQFESFQYQALSGEPMRPALLSLAVGSNTIAMHCFSHRHDGVLIVEMEPVDGVHSLHPLNIDSHVRGPLSRMEAASNILELSQIARKPSESVVIEKVRDRFRPRLANTGRP
jgi:hypothetical protein